MVVNAVNHNFLPIPQSTFPMLQSTVEMESSRYCSQTIGTTSFNLLTSQDELTRPENVLLPSQDAYIRRHLYDREYRPKYRPSSTG